MASSSKKKLKITSSQTKSYAFSSEQDEILIELVSQNPTLYDLKLESYKDGVKKENIWKYIGKPLNKTSEDCKKRWKHIKDSYNRYKRKKKIGTRSAALPKTSKWEFYERLKFLESSPSPKEKISYLPSLSQRSQNESIDKDNNDNVENDICDDDIKSIQSTIVNEVKDEKKALKDNTENVASKKKRKNKQDEFVQYMENRDIKRQALFKPPCEEKLDEDDANSFGDHIKAVLKKLPPILKVKAKAEIFNVMSKYELMSMETSHSTSSASSMSR